jgi:hypothetical protein
MRYWLPVLALLLIVAIMLPVSRAVHTIIGDAQIVFALALVALLVRLVAQAIATPEAGPPT